MMDRSQQHLEQQPEGIPVARVAAVVLTFLLIGGAAVGLVAWMTPMSPARPALPSPSSGAPIDSLELSMTEVARGGEDAKELERSRIDQLGWVDPDAGIARIPVQDAIDIWLERREETP